MLNPRLLIVGLFATVCTWLPASLSADELSRPRPMGYTLDLFGMVPGPESATLLDDCRPAYGNTRPAYGNYLVSAPQRSDLREPTTFDFHFAGVSNEKVNWDPVVLDDLGAGRRVSAQRPPAVAGVTDDGKAPCEHCCPLCQAPLPQADAAEYVPEEPAEMKLREGEPAKVLLQTMKQVRPSILDGTIFQESRPIDGTEAMPLEGEGAAAIIVHCIRNLEAEADRHRLPEGTACLSSSTAPTAPTCPIAAPEATPDAVTALRQAGRELKATANMLEERGLYDQADQLRAVAQEMRIQARVPTASSRPTVSYAPTPMPGPGGDGDELAGDEDLDQREPKLRYDGDGDDND